MARLRRAIAFAIAGTLVAVACDNALRSRSGRSTVGGGANYTFTFAWPDGNSEATIVSGGGASVELALPATGYQRVVDPVHGTVDATRLSVTASVDLGDPAGEFIAAGTDVAPRLDAAGRLLGRRADDGRPEIELTFEEADLAPFPIGRLVWTVSVLDDIDRAAPPLQVGLTVRAPDRPTAVLTLEIPPFGSTEPTALPLPIDEGGVPFIGAGLDFVLALRAIPNVDSGARFDGLFDGDGVPDPARVSIVADHDLGDPANGGLLAGENAALLLGAELDVAVDPDTGETLAAILFTVDGPFAPPLGDTTFHAVVLDDSGTSSFEATALLRSVAVKSLSGDVQPILSNRCINAACHGNSSPAAGLKLTKGNTWSNAVRVRSSQTPSDSCATLRIDPWFPDFSYLLHKVKNTHKGGCVNGSGNRMPPPPNGALTSAQITTIESWIEQGAHDN